VEALWKMRDVEGCEDNLIQMTEQRAAWLLGNIFKVWQYQSLCCAKSAEMHLFFIGGT
jgi:hypothetical protein